MAETEIRTDGIDQLIKSWEDLLKKYPSLKRETLDALGRRMLFEVVWGIGPSENVQHWQGYYIGSKNGYVAVRPKADTWQVTKSGNRYAVGYVTNAIENGHRNRKPQPTGKKNYHYTKGQNTTAATPGKHFYDGARTALDRMAAPLVQQLAEEVAARLEGKT